MLVYAIAIAVALLLVPLTGGRLRQLAHLRLRRVWLLFAGLGLQILLEVIDLPKARYEDLGLAILLASYVLIIGFGLSNLLLTGMGVITVGIAMNAFVIALNQGMPYRVPAGVKAETTVKHRPEKSGDLLPQLGDYIPLGSPVDASISFGDLVIAIGLIDVAFRSSRRPRRSRSHTPASPEDLDEDRPREIALDEADTKEVVVLEERDLRVDAGDPLQRVEHSRVVDVTRS
jgi:hypothetical protein